MKSICILLYTALLVGCRESPSSKEALQITGVYTHDGYNEFREASDTITITAFNKEARTYRVVRSTGFTRIADGKLQQREFIKEEMTAVYNEKNQQLEETRTGVIFIFPGQKNQLLLGSVTYLKIK